MPTPENSESWNLPKYLEQIRMVDPGCTFVSRRVLRKFGLDLRPGAATWLVFGHRPALIVSTQAALQLAEPDELGFDRVPEELERLVLLERPDPYWLAATPASEVLTRLWRALFHARVHEAMSTAKLTQADIFARITKLGLSNFAEARTVLEQERRLEPDEEETTALIEFTATFLELYHFQPALIEIMFPGAGKPKECANLLSDGLNIPSLLERSRPPAANSQNNSPVQTGSERSHSEEDLLEPEPGELDDRPGTVPAWLGDQLLRRARRAASRGNDVRAAVNGARFAALTGKSIAESPEETCKKAIERLAQRLQAATAGAGKSAAEWTAALLPLAKQAALGFRGSSARLLYDLQLLAIEHESPSYKLELMDCVLSLGRRPLKRPMPNHREVQIVRHLRHAIGRLGRVRLNELDHRRITSLLHQVIDNAEDKLRERFQPLILRSLERADLDPSNLAERVAKLKLTEELLDQIVAKGFLTSGDVRDALSRNALKLPDMALADLYRGDPFLRTDQRLGLSLSGIYRSAEIYLRMLQKGSSVAFGTMPGRYMVLWLILPFGVAFVVLEGLQHLIEPLLGMFHGQIPFLSGQQPTPADHTNHASIHLMTPLRWGLLGAFILALIHSPKTRTVTWELLRSIGQGLRTVLVDTPRRLAAQPWVQAIVTHPAARWLWSWILRPAVPALAVGWFLSYFGVDKQSCAVCSLGLYLVFLWMNQSVLGRALEEELRERIAYTVDRLRFNLIPGLFQLIVGFFSYSMEALDRLIYAVDEALRFRAGEGTLTLVLKAVAGALWGVFSYVVRLVLNLLVEPQINPIKHFPVVTVAHKLTLPFMLALPPFLTASPFNLKPVTASGLAFSLQLLVPGIFGFLVWELKENWRLYRANRPNKLIPEIVGSHGETVTRLLRPGFHSGTVSRAFSSLRKAENAIGTASQSRRTHTQRERLIHVEHALSNFVARDFLEVLRQSRSLKALPLRVSHVSPSPCRLRVEILHEHAGEKPLSLVFEEREGWLLAQLEHSPDWVGVLDPEGKDAFRLALAGLYHRAGVDLVHEQLCLYTRVDQAFPRIEFEGLKVFRPAPLAQTVWYPLRDVVRLGNPQESSHPDQTSSTSQLLFKLHPIAWSDWVNAWECEAAGKPISKLVSTRILPS